MVMHPTVPELDGKILDKPQYYSIGEEKRNLFTVFNELCAKNGEGYLQYLWPKPTEDGLTEDQPKFSYSRLHRDWGWILGTGVYVAESLQ